MRELKKFKIEGDTVERDKKILLIATVQSHICQFHKPLVAMLHEHGCEVHVAARNNLAEKNGLKLDFVEQVFDVPFQRSPFSPKNLGAYKQLKKIIDEGSYDVIHCNTPVGGVLGRLAARKARKHSTKVFYTAHGFHFYKGAPKKNWLIWYPVEKFMCRHTDKLITINEEDYQLARSKFPVETCHIHGVGVSVSRYHPHSAEEEEVLRKEESLSAQDFVVLCTGELNANKDQRTLIDAAVLCRDRIPELKVLLAGNGPLESTLREQISGNHAEGYIRLLGYRTDLGRVVPAADVIVSCSHREGLGLNLIEGMLCGKTVIAVENRGHRELIENCVTGYLVPIGDSRALAERLVQLHNDTSQKELGQAGYKKVQLYTDVSVQQELAHIYGFGVS